MNTTMEGKVVFWGDADSLDNVMDFCEQYGETDFDSITDTVSLKLEEDWEGA